MLTVLAVISVIIAQAYGHGMMLVPPNRSSIWREYPDMGPVNYDDNQNFCGGRAVQYDQNGGKCGPCGDNLQDGIPRANENGGTYGRGFIPETSVYKSGTNMQVQIYITASHLGWFEFSICDLSIQNPETEECFDRIKLNRTDTQVDRQKYFVTHDIDTAPQTHNVFLEIPSNLHCDRCVLRWHYWTGNSDGLCEDGTYQLGCGDQEVFRSCADIKIL